MFFNIDEYITNSSDFLILSSKLSTLLEIHVKFSLYPQHPFNSKLQLETSIYAQSLVKDARNKTENNL